MPLQNNDILLVNRNGNSHRYSFENLKRDVLSDIELQLTGLEWVARNPTGATEISGLPNTASTPRDWDTVDVLLFGPGNDLSEVTLGATVLLTNVTSGHTGTYDVVGVNAVTRQIDVTYISDTGGDIQQGNTFSIAVLEPAVQYWTRDEATATLSPVNENDNVALLGKATSASTVDADPDTTLVTKDYVDNGLEEKVNLGGDTMTGDLTVPNLSATGTITATGKITGGDATFTGNLLTNNGTFTGDITAGGDITADGNISGANGIFEGDVTAGSDITANGNITATGKVTGGDATFTGNLLTNNGTFTGDVTAGGSITADENISGANGIFQGDVQTTSLNGGPLAGLRNQLINGSFAIHQRGNNFNNTSGTNGFFADRWIAVGNDGTWSANLYTTGAPLGFANAYAVNVDAMRQAIELPAAGKRGPFTEGSTWTISIWANKATLGGCQFLWRDGASNATNEVNAGTATFTPTGETSNGFTRYSGSLTFGIGSGGINATSTCLVANFFFNTKENTLVCGAQIEPGPVATPFEMRPLGTELALCQRYFFKHDRRIVAYAYTNREFRLFEYQFPTTMRRVPDLTFPINSNWKVGTLSRTATVDGFEVEGWADDEGQTTYIEGLTADAEL